MMKLLFVEGKTSRLVETQTRCGWSKSAIGVEGCTLEAAINSRTAINSRGGAKHVFFTRIQHRQQTVNKKYRASSGKTSSS